jgi:hypothetical protein
MADTMKPDRPTRDFEVARSLFPRGFSWLFFSVLLITISHGEENVPMVKGPKPIEAPHFPDRLHTFVWRNWSTADLSTMAEVVGTTPEKVREIGESMSPELAPRAVRSVAGVARLG